MRKLYALLAGLFIALGATLAAPPSPDIANFTFLVDATANNVVFNNTSILGSEPGIRKAFWSFGDGSGAVTLPLAGTSHHYASAGTYNVCLRIYRYRPVSNDSVLSAQICKSVIVPVRCGADFERINIATTPNSLLAFFRALPSHNANARPIKICWQFGDGSDTCIQYTNTYPGPYTVNHQYNMPGNYQVCVRILYQGGCEARKCRDILMTRPDTCGADFVKLPISITPNPLDVILKALPAHNNNRKPARVCWQFGDGSDTCINYPENYTGLYVVPHRYPHGGVFEPCVKITYFGGCEARRCHPIEVPRPDTCAADFEKLPVTATANPLLAVFKALPAHNNNRKPARVCWQFGDGSDTCINYTETYSGPYTAAHRYNNPGLYEVCVKILYFGGCEARKCKPVQVGRPDTCGADFERTPVTAANPLVQGFRALPFHNNNKKPQEICWRFGDGTDTCITYTNSYTGPYTIAHRYNVPGTYEVCVRITYFGGCQANKCRPVVIPPPNDTCRVTLLEITPSITSLQRGFAAVPNSNPPRRPVRVCWEFGDGTDTCWLVAPTTPLPVLFIPVRHTYPGPGHYVACVKVLFEGGCVARDCKEVNIRPASNVCGGFMTDSMAGPRTFRFKGFGIHNPGDEVVGYRWTFGDGSLAIGREVTHTYAAPGNYTVCLLMNTRLGCETRICKTVHVPGNNTPALTLSPNPVQTVVTASFLSTHTETVNIRILNGTGNPVRTFTRNANVGGNTWTFDLSTLAPGVYSFVVQSPNQLASVIFIKI